jgi:hypothetical protein
MAQKRGFIPRSYPAYDTFFRNAGQYTGMMCTGAEPQWTHILQAEQEALSAAYGDWSAAYTRILVPHIPADTAAAKAAFGRKEQRVAVKK